MKEKIIVKGTGIAMVGVHNEYSPSVADQLADIVKGRRPATALAFHHRPLGGDYTVVGTVELVVTVESPDVLVANEIAALQAQLREERVKAEQIQQMLRDRISKLQALTLQA